MWAVILIPLCISYIIFRCWKEASQEGKDSFVMNALVFAAFFVPILGLSILAQWFPITVIIITLIALVVVIVNSVRYHTDPEYRTKLLFDDMADRKKILQKRTDNFYKTFQDHNVPITKLVAEVLAEKYRPDAIRYNVGEAYSWANQKFTLYFTSCNPETRKKVLGINEYDIPLSEYSLSVKSKACAKIIVSNCGLSYEDIDMQMAVLRFNHGEPLHIKPTKDIDAVVNYIIENLQDKVEINLDLITAKMILNHQYFE